MKIGFNEGCNRFCENHSVLEDLDLCEKYGFDYASLGQESILTLKKYNDLIIHKTIGGQECLLVYGRTRTLEDILLRYDGRSANKWYEHSHGFDSVLEADIHRQIEGTYRDGLEAWRITHDSILIYSLSSLPGQPHRSYAYTIRWGETDMPEHVLSLSDGRKLCFTLWN